jgi:hypothetical protein
MKAAVSSHHSQQKLIGELDAVLELHLFLDLGHGCSAG